MTADQIELMKAIIRQHETIIELNFQLVQLIAPVDMDDDEKVTLQ